MEQKPTDIDDGNKSRLRFKAQITGIDTEKMENVESLERAKYLVDFIERTAREVFGGTDPDYIADTFERIEELKYILEKLKTKVSKTKS